MKHRIASAVLLFVPAALVAAACTPTPLEMAKAPIEAPAPPPKEESAKGPVTAEPPTDKPAGPKEPSDDELLAIMNGKSDGSDPAKGHFSLAQATAGLPGDGPLVAVIRTTEGDLRCQLDADRAPHTVANFVGLARGKRPWKNPNGQWVMQPAYDGTPFHRVIKGFMIQGGDPTGTGAGEPGYTIPDERRGAKHDRAGLLCMANRGPNTNGMQFFITDDNAPHLDRGPTTYTVFGECSPVSVVHAIANLQTDGTDRPLKLPQMTTVTIERAR